MKLGRTHRSRWPRKLLAAMITQWSRAASFSRVFLKETCITETAVHAHSLRMKNDVKNRCQHHINTGDRLTMEDNRVAEKVPPQWWWWCIWKYALKKWCMRCFMVFYEVSTGNIAHNAVAYEPTTLAVNCVVRRLTSPLQQQQQQQAIRLKTNDQSITRMVCCDQWHGIFQPRAPLNP